MTLLLQLYYKKIKNVLLGANKLLITKKLISGKKTDRKKNTKEYINKNFFSASKKGSHTISIKFCSSVLPIFFFLSFYF